MRLLFVTEGSGSIAAEGLRRWSAVRLQHGEDAELRATSRLELMELSVRSISDLKLDAVASYSAS